MYFCLHPEYFVKLFRCVRQKGAENLSIRFISTKRFKTETSRIFFLHQASCYNFKLVKLHKGEYAVRGIPQSSETLQGAAKWDEILTLQEDSLLAEVSLGKRERGERPLKAFDAFFCVASDHICGRN